MLSKEEQQVLKLLNEHTPKASNGCIGLVGDSLVYEKNDDSGDFCYIDYEKLGFDYQGMSYILDRLSKLKFIDFIDTNNMQYFIYVK